MPVIPNRKVEVEVDPSRRFNKEKLTAGEYLTVMTPWPKKLIPHKHPFKEGLQTQSWPLRFEECTASGALGRQITLWVECEPSGVIAGTEVGELRWRPLADALELDESDGLDTDELSWSAVIVIVKSKVKADGSISAWIEDFKVATEAQVMIAGDYLAIAHPGS